MWDIPTRNLQDIFTRGILPVFDSFFCPKGGQMLSDLNSEARFSILLSIDNMKYLHGIMSSRYLRLIIFDILDLIWYDFHMLVFWSPMHFQNFADLGDP